MVDYVSACLSLTKAGQEADFSVLGALWSAYQYHIFVFLCGFCVFGSVLLSLIHI